MIAVVCHVGNDGGEDTGRPVADTNDEVEEIAVNRCNAEAKLSVSLSTFCDFLSEAFASVPCLPVPVPSPWASFAPRGRASRGASRSPPLTLKPGNSMCRCCSWTFGSVTLFVSLLDICDGIPDNEPNLRRASLEGVLATVS